MLLLGKPLVNHLDDETRKYIKTHALHDSYVAIFLLSDDKSSEVYVGLKAKKAKMLGLYAKIYLGKDWELVDVLSALQEANEDEKCVGIMVQLPLVSHLKAYQSSILETIAPEKDIDGLGSWGFGLNAFGIQDFLGATPKAALEILKYYAMDDFAGKVVTIIGRSNLIGKPLTMELIKREATVITCNSQTERDFLKNALASSQYIMSATGKKHLIHKDVLNEDTCKSQVPLHEKILVDIGRGHDEEGPYGDIDWKYYEDKVKALTPVPGGVGPVTVSCLFHNVHIDRRIISNKQ